MLSGADKADSPAPVSTSPTSRLRRRGWICSMRRASARNPLVVEFVVGRWARRGARRAALQKLGMALTRLASGTFCWVAANLGLQLDDVEEDVSLPAQFVCDHGGL